jgi:hypothetical protein
VAEIRQASKMLLEQIIACGAATAIREAVESAAGNDPA